MVFIIKQKQNIRIFYIPALELLSDGLLAGAASSVT